MANPTNPGDAQNFSAPLGPLFKGTHPVVAKANKVTARVDAIGATVDLLRAALLVLRSGGGAAVVVVTPAGELQRLKVPGGTLQPL